jgi:hypothetical protein
MASTLITFFRWSLIRTSTLLLVLVWVFNPLGSQASFRGVYLRERNGIEQGEVTYFNPDLIVGLQNMSSFEPRKTTFSTGLDAYDVYDYDYRFEPLVRPLYTAVFYDSFSRTQYANHDSQTYRNLISSLGGQSTAGIRAAMDPWGNVRIPHLEYMDDYNGSDPHRWLQTPWTDKIQHWSGLIGDPLEGVSREIVGNTTFNITSSYQSFNVRSNLRFSTHNR